MKKIILGILIGISFYSNAQVKTIKTNNATEVLQKLKINGLGKLQLGMSVGDLDELKGAITMTSSMDYITKVWNKRSNVVVYEQISDSTKFEKTFGSPNKNERVFTIPVIKITDNISIKLVELKFYNDKLYYINFDFDKDVNDALTIKYGEPKIENKENIKKFTNTYTGNTVEKTEMFFTYEWNTNDSNIECISKFIKYFNDKGEQNYISYTQIKNKIIESDMNKLKEIYIANMKTKEEKAKKAKLSGI